MRVMDRAGVILTVVAALACGSPPKQGAPRRAASPEVTPAQWEEAWDLVTEFGEPIADLGPWRVENAGAIIVSRKGPRADAIPDEALRTTVEAEVSRAVRDARAVSISVGNGVVHLHGGFPSRGEAGKAVFAALGARGVDQIVSHLTWPGSSLKPLRPRLQTE